ncbi:hydroxypyruvate isomerase family protein [Paracoccus pacificus]|uniref:Hydroxypyruvate isomerase family protein n=1 Tax=Paracoccus pacificus TaxID=1463598 RepID=A0ABW4R6A6_9RHOB
MALAPGGGPCYRAGTVELGPFREIDMRISANLGFLYGALPQIERIAAAARDGFDAVEFHCPYEVPAADLAAALAQAGLPGLGINTRPGDAAAGEFGLGAVPGRETEADAYLDEALDYAAAAGIRNIHVMAGKASGAAAERSFVRHLSRGAARAENLGITLLIEPLNSVDVPGYFLTGTDHARRIVEQVGRSALRIMYDLYHMQIMQGNNINRIRALGPLIGHLQIAAVPGRAEPDRGELAMGRVLRDCGYTGFVGAEYRPTIPPGEWLSRFRERLEH